MRVYTVITDEYEGFILAIAADSAKEARLIAYHNIDCDLPWIEIKPKWQKGIDVTGLEKGRIPLKQGVKLGLYGWIEDECPKCGKFKKLTLTDSDMILCSDCEEGEKYVDSQIAK